MLWRVSSRAGAVFRRRRGRTAGGLSRHRPGPAAAEARPVVPLRPAGRRPGPRRHPARQGRAGPASGADRDPALRRGAVPEGGARSSRWIRPSAGPGSRGGCARPPSAIQDKDLAEQYRRELFDRFDALFPAPPRAAGSRPRRQGGRWRPGPPPKLGQTAEGAQAMQSLSRSIEPVAAALAHGAHRRSGADGRPSGGHRSPRLRRSVRWTGWRRRWFGCASGGQDLDSGGLASPSGAIGSRRFSARGREGGGKVRRAFPGRRHAPRRSTGPMVAGVRRAHPRGGAGGCPGFGEAGMPGAATRRFSRLKAERDALRRAIKTGEIWEDSAGS